MLREYWRGDRRVLEVGRAGHVQKLQTSSWLQTFKHLGWVLFAFFWGGGGGGVGTRVDCVGIHEGFECFEV